MILVDANLLIYAVNRDAPEHAVAHRWWEDTLSGTTRTGLPWMVILAFVRLTTNARIVRAPLRVEQALAYMDQWLQQPYVHSVSAGERHWQILGKLLERSGTAGNLTNDAHIAALAIEHACTIYSADNDFKRFDGVAHVNPLAPGEVHEVAATY